MKLFQNKGNNDNHTHKHSSLKHMLHMVLCCAIPIIIIFALPFIATISPASAVILGFITPFICPVMMGGMLFLMFRKGKPSCCEEKTVNNPNSVSSK